MPGKKLLVLSSEFVVTLIFVLLTTTNYEPSTVYAQTCPTGIASNARASWLVTALDVVGNFTSNINQCVRSADAKFQTTQIDPYATLKTKFYTNPGTGTIVSSGSPLNITNGGRHLSNGNLTVSSISGPNPGAAVVFVDGNLTINSNITYGGATDTGNNQIGQGVVFVVRDNVFITSGVTQINAFIIAAGATSIVCTASTDPTCAPGKNAVPLPNTSQLKVNGSIISLATAAGDRIVFNRTLTDNSNTPAEKFNFEPKYYLLFKDLFSEPRQLWKEIAGVVPTL